MKISRKEKKYGKKHGEVCGIYKEGREVLFSNLSSLLYDPNLAISILIEISVSFSLQRRRSGSIMGSKIGLLLLLLVGIIGLNNVDARNLVTSVTLAERGNYTGLKNYTEASDAKDDSVCSLCKQYASVGIDYLQDTKTQTEIVETLHRSCSYTHSLKTECISMVDYYAPLFFTEIAAVQPEELCRKLDLCYMAFASEDTCTVCHEAVAKVLEKLKDPDTQLEIIEMLLKLCKKTEQYEKKCKRLVFEYGPLVMANAEKYLAKNDLCTAIHACNETSTDGKIANAYSVESS